VVSGIRNRIMRILQSGVPKSGNFLLYNIIQEILNKSNSENNSFIKNQKIYSIIKDFNLTVEDQAGIDVIDIENNSKCFYRISSIFRMPIENMEKYLNDGTHFWTHSKFRNSSASTYKKFDKIIYIIRDPRDALISMARFMFTPYMLKYYPTSYDNEEKYIRSELSKHFKYWINHVFSYLYLRESSNNIKFVFFERLVRNTKDEIVEIANFLEMDLNDSLIDEIVNNVSFSKLKSKNPNHIQKGDIYGWIELLDSQELNFINNKYKQVIKAFNYPLNLENNKELPILPEGIPKFKNSLSLQERFSLIKKAIS